MQIIKLSMRSPPRQYSNWETRSRDSQRTLSTLIKISWSSCSPRLITRSIMASSCQAVRHLQRTGVVREVTRPPKTPTTLLTRRLLCSRSATSATFRNITHWVSRKQGAALLALLIQSSTISVTILSFSRCMSMSETVLKRLQSMDTTITVTITTVIITTQQIFTIIICTIIQAWLSARLPLQLWMQLLHQCIMGRGLASAVLVKLLVEVEALY